jgi:hypothetical protein
MQTETDKQLLGNNMFNPAFAENHAADSALPRPAHEAGAGHGGLLPLRVRRRRGGSCTSGNI